jgi:hypothetical protein
MREDDFLRTIAPHFHCHFGNLDHISSLPYCMVDLENPTLPSWIGMQQVEVAVATG